jgi:hypothetical protein
VTTQRPEEPWREKIRDYTLCAATMRWRGQPRPAPDTAACQDAIAGKISGDRVVNPAPVPLRARIALQWRCNKPLPGHAAKYCNAEAMKLRHAYRRLEP